MANTKSAKKRIKVTERRRLRNQPIRTRMKTFTKRAEKLIAEGDGEAARQAVVAAVSVIDRAASKGVLHPNNAARCKSRLMRKLNKVSV